MFRFLLTVIGCAMLCGCASDRVVDQHQSIRHKLVGLYQEQIEDNLARVKAGRAFVHVNYSEIKGSSRDEVTGKLQHGDNDTEVVGDGNVIVEGPDSDELTVSAEGKFWNEMHLKGDPVLGNETVYDAYILFADYLVKSGAPTEDDVLWHRTVNGKKYWMSGRASEAFRRLVMLSTLDQGKNRKITMVEVQSIKADGTIKFSDATAIDNLGRGYLIIDPSLVSMDVDGVYPTAYAFGRGGRLSTHEQDRMKRSGLSSKVSGIRAIVEYSTDASSKKPTQVTVSGPGLSVNVK